jgi:hypothetical protein
MRRRARGQFRARKGVEPILEGRAGSHRRWGWSRAVSCPPDDPGQSFCSAGNLVFKEQKMKWVCPDPSSEGESNPQPVRDGASGVEATGGHRDAALVV